MVNLIVSSSGLSVVACYMLARFGMGPGGFGTGLDLSVQTQGICLGLCNARA